MMSLDQKKTILITGINGFLGSHLARKLFSYYNIIGLENSPTELFRLNGISCKMYFSKEIGLEEIFKENELYAILHTATIYKKTTDSLEVLLRSNLLLPIKLFELSQKYKVERFINTDTFYNDNNLKYSYLAEYTLSKKHALEWLRSIPGKCKLINMKIFHMYGPNDSLHKFVSSIIKSLMENIPFINLTPGEQMRDFIYIDDVVEAYRIILNVPDLVNGNFMEFEVGTGNAISIKDFVILIKEITGSKTELRFGVLPYRKNEIMEAKANNLSLVSLGWNPSFTIEAGLNSQIKKENKII